MSDVERIEAAALLVDGEVLTQPPPARHHTLIRAWCETHGGRIGDHDQGFVTSAGRFIRRAPAARLAFEAGQISEPKPSLFSEDLW